MTTNNHPAHGPASLDRLHQIREHLQHDTQYSNGGNRAYILADMLKVVDECWQVGTPSQWQMSLTGTKKVKKEPVIYAGAVLMSHPGRSMLFHQS
ncbi:hypothetical protein ACXG1R_003645 [Escherichia coli]|uniref:hypothetical protein n=1 Tax=Escherichia coli TaxID=562 RepID=UPI001D0C5ED4|nr:hypothetical protein [Escherichia coli]DAJ01227.1 MAG TPA: hypothetical protein [Caudoviricetes sp.]MCL6979046.1 hypothetical protein [Escherichia coli]MCN4818918.1 hypothetical protein [Escherichia coli]MDC7099546.1 hypothetical protein [Escherichia coli]MDO2858199.1 hypothetical protein [Escherichia coli]